MRPKGNHDSDGEKVQEGQAGQNYQVLRRFQGKCSVKEKAWGLTGRRSRALSAQGRGGIQITGDESGEGVCEDQPRPVISGGCLERKVSYRVAGG